MKVITSYHILFAGCYYNIASVFAQGPTAAPVLNPSCPICGCSFCPTTFTVGNPSGVIPIPPEFLAQAPQGLTQIPCSLLDFAGSSGQIPANLCNDDLRLLPEFRTICGCPALPPRPTAPVAAPVTAPVARPPTAAPVAAPVARPPTAAPVAAPVARPPTAAPVTAPRSNTTSAPVMTPRANTTSAPVPRSTPVVAPVAVPVVMPVARPPTAPSKKYIDEIYYLSHPVSSSYSSNSTTTWVTVTNVKDKNGTAGFLHEYCARTVKPAWYCTGSYVDLYYETSSKYGTIRKQYIGLVSYSGYFDDTKQEGYFTITGGTDDFRSAKGHVFVTHVGNSSTREMHAWY